MPVAEEETRTSTKRRLSFRKSLVECSSLPDGYLDALEQKRKSLDESIHKYIASKEREYKQFEKELRHQAKRAEKQDAPHQIELSKHDPPLSTVDTILRPDSRKKLHDNTAEADYGHDMSDAANSRHHEARRLEDFPGLFVPEYLVALDHHMPERTASEPPRGASDDKAPPILRTNSDTVAEAVQRARIPLTQRTSSSGSSIDGRLVSALKSASTDTSRAKHKRVSLAVGDTIVAPSDNVPLPLTNNRTSSHSKSRSSPGRDRGTFLSGGRTPAPSVTADVPASQDEGSAGVSAAIQTLREQGSAAAASATDHKRPVSVVQPNEDVGDMFDLEENELNAAYDDALLDASPDSQIDNQIIGRVSNISPTEADIETRQEDQSSEQDGSLPDADDQEVATALIFSDNASVARPPLSPGFKRPSAVFDPMHGGRSQATDGSYEDRSFYGSSFSRTNKGSFTSSSLGESYMARNAERMMEMRSQQPQDRPRQSRQSSHALPVR